MATWQNGQKATIVQLGLSKYGFENTAIGFWPHDT